MSQLRDIGELVIGGIGALVAIGLIAFVLVGGMFYRVACPSEVAWSFNPLPFVETVDLDVARGEATACSTDTATGYYTGKVPVIGGTLRGFVKAFTGQAE